MNRKHIISSILFAFLLFHKGECQNNLKLDSLQAVNYAQSDIVFLGEIKCFDTLVKLTTEFNVLELFKGDIDSIITIKFRGENSLLPISDGLWLIYAKKTEDNYFYIVRSGISRSNKDPDRIFYYTPAMPLRKKEFKNLERQMVINKIDASVDWFNELYLLRLKCSHVK